MKINLKYKQIILFVSLLLISPVFVLAEKCYVNDDAGSGGDGSSSHPYKTITKALDEECTNIKVKKGEYDEKVKLGDGVKLEGAGETTIITGEIVMDDSTTLESVYAKGGGIEVKDKANVLIRDARITEAGIGIETKGSGKLVIRNCKINDNEKGLYIQYGKDIDIKNSEIINNSEEGLDIRANVDGIVEGNKINGNKESGIEVIAGKSELVINNNSLHNNKSSGIAVQFYKSTSQIGKLKILGNTLTGNSNYGIDCKNPSGGVPGFNYWSRSVRFEYNKVGSNKKGDFAPMCKFSKEEIWQASMTEEEIKKLQDEIKKRLGEKGVEVNDNKIKSQIEANREEDSLMDKIIKEAIKEAEIQQKDIGIKDRVQKLTQKNYKKFENNSTKINQEIEEYSKIKTFFMGPDSKLGETLKKQASKCRSELKKAQPLLIEIETGQIKTQTEELLKNGEVQCKKLSANYDSYQDTFGLWSWFKKTF